ncbi:uroporphyrinogen-III C-methyltransferase [Halomonas sp. Bachu 37]|uniref:uroporphyrinogen-III C-methyltransferase n=1 Tax=Halomonas kashgarensis TaxID=3084920 RepID=UPI0032178C97
MSKQPYDQDDTQKPSADTNSDRSASSEETKAASSTGPAPGNASGQQRKSRRYNNRKNAANGSQEAGGKGNPPDASAKPSSASATPGSGAVNGQDDKTVPPTSKPETSATATSASNASSANTNSSSTGSSSTGSSSTDSSSTRTSSTPSAKATTPPPPSGTTTGGGKSSGGGKAGLLALALVVILAIAVLLFGWQGWQRLDSQQQRLDDIAASSQESASQEELQALESRLDSGETERNEALDSALEELRSEFESYRSEVDETLDEVLAELSSEQETDDREWLHAEAAYLLRLANQRLQLERDVEGAIALLETADERLAEADNPALTPVRRAIANELAALEGVPELDRTGLYLALNAQQERIANLRLSQEIEERAITSGIEQPPSGAFERQLARFGAELRDLVVVRHHDEALEALITPEQESYLRQSLRLILEQSQLALLKEEQELFEASLDKAVNLLEGYYDTSRSETQAVIERLEELKQTRIQPELPDISESQQTLSDFIEHRFQSRSDDGGEA